MSESRLKENAAAVRKLFGTAAKLAQKQAALATLNNVTLPKLYHAIGKKIVGLEKLPPDLVPHREKIRALEAGIAAKPEEPQAAPAEGFAAKAKQFAQQAARKASKATANAAATVQIHAAYVSLGRAAVDKYGDKSVPKEVLPDLQQTTRNIAELKEEIATLSNASGQGLLTPGRLLLAGGLGVAVLLGFVFLRMFSRNDSPVERSSAVTVAETNRQPVEKKQRANASLEEVRAGTQRKLDAIKKGGEIDRFRSNVQDHLSKWQTAAEQLKGSLLREPSLQSTSDDASSAAWSNLAQRNDQSLAKSYSEMWQRLRSEAEKCSADDNALASASADELNTALAAFAEACDSEKANLARAREQAIAEIVKFRASLKAAKETVLQELTKGLQDENTRWDKTAMALREPITADSAVTSLEKPVDADGLARLASQSQAELDRFATQQQKNVRDELKRIGADSTQRLREAKTESEAQSIVQTAKQRSAKAVSDSIERVTAHREQGIKVLKDFVGMEQHAKAEKARQKQLTGRQFSGPAGLTDDELRDVLANAPNITDLFLEESTRLTNKCIEDIAKVRDLRRLELPPRCEITTEGLRPLRDKKVTLLKLPEAVFENQEGFEIFVSMLDDATRVAPADSQALGYTGTRSDGYTADWDLYPLGLGDNCLKAIQGVRKLKDLGTPKDATDRGLAMLAAIPDLAAVEITLSPKITNAGIASLRKCRGLKKVTLIDDHQARTNRDFYRENRSESPASAEGIGALNGLGLHILDIPVHMRVEACFKPFLSALGESEEREIGKSLRSITLTDPRRFEDWPFTKTTIKSMAGKKGIQIIRIDACGCDDEMLQGLGDIPDLEELVLWDLPAIGGAGLRGLGNAKKLRTLTIHGCGQFGNEGLRCIAECGNLLHLTLSDLPKTTDDGLLMLGACKKLLRLHIKQTSGTPVAEVKLENAIEDLDVYFEQ